MKTSLFVSLLAAAPVMADGLPGTLYELVHPDGGPFERLEASGVSYFAGRLVVVDDTLNSLFVFDPRGRLAHQLDSRLLPSKQAKFEDIAFHPDTGTFFAVGSHSGWDPTWLEQASVLYEFRLRDVAEIDDATVRALPLYAVFEKLGLWKPRGMKIEGLAVDDGGETLFVGLREPVDRARVYALALESLRHGVATPTVVVEFDAGFAEGTPFCISALEWHARHQGLLLMTSTEDETTHRFLGNRLWFSVPGQEPVLLLDRFDEGMKAEGLAIGAGRLFIVYDNDQDDTRIPSHLRVAPLGPILAKLTAAAALASPDRD